MVASVARIDMKATPRQRLAIDHRRQVRQAENAAKAGEWQSAATHWGIAADYAKMLERSYWQDNLMTDWERMNYSLEWGGIHNYDKSRQINCLDLVATTERT